MLPEPGALAVFIVAALVLLVVPGPAVLYIVAQSISRGRLAGIVSMLGIQVGGLVHIAAAAAGLSALLVRSGVAFNIVKYAGAAYLVFLGLRRLLGREQLDTVGARPEKSLRRLFAQGIVVNVLNPKTALFFFSFLPQFVDVEQGSVALQIATLGLIFILLATVSDGLYALAAGSAAGWLRGRPGFVRGERFATGGVLVGLGVIAAFSGANKSR
ncbi:MAG TPA: LysE family translocator [Gaiellaceae bacterium]|jgi:threonine/homoserine/homoserine lactone efflux protein|nr:LysE family translocator [Gaiellaceae bacterium]